LKKAQGIGGLRIKRINQRKRMTLIRKRSFFSDANPRPQKRHWLLHGQIWRVCGLRGQAGAPLNTLNPQRSRKKRGCLNPLNPQQTHISE
jgi:hypothetical protein